MNTGNFPLPDIQCRLHREDGLNPEHQKAGVPKDSGRESSFSDSGLMPATGAGPSFADFSEEVIALVIYQNKGGEVFHFNFQMASMPSSGYSSSSTFLMLFLARMAAGPPMEPR